MVRVAATLEERKGWQNKSSVTACSEGDPDLYGWQLLYFGIVPNFKSLLGLITHHKNWMQRMQDRGYDDPRMVTTTIPGPKRIAEAVEKARKARSKLWGRSHNRPLGEAAKMADDQHWQARLRPYTAKKTGSCSKICRYYKP